jgi:hypothetical protein
VWCRVEEEIVALNPDYTPDSQSLAFKPERGDHTRIAMARRVDPRHGYATDVIGALGREGERGAGILTIVASRSTDVGTVDSATSARFKER